MVHEYADKHKATVAEDLAACCRKRGAKFGQFLFTADSLANVHEYDARDFGLDSHEKALLPGLDILRDWK